MSRVSRELFPTLFCHSSFYRNHSPNVLEPFVLHASLDSMQISDMSFIQLWPETLHVVLVVVDRVQNRTVNNVFTFWQRNTSAKFARESDGSYKLKLWILTWKKKQIFDKPSLAPRYENLKKKNNIFFLKSSTFSNSHRESISNIFLSSWIKGTHATWLIKED